jgi:hypothetical protein
MKNKAKNNNSIEQNKNDHETESAFQQEQQGKKRKNK